MKIQLLGTGAAEGIPAILASTRVSDYARSHGGRDVRLRASALIDGVLKIDFGPDSLAQIHQYRLDTRDWIGLVFTHSHEDHFSPAEIQYFLDPFSDLDHVPFPIYGNHSICAQLEEKYPDWPMELVETRSFESSVLAPYVITPVRAHHKPDEDAHNLIVARDGKKLLYATDTGVWDEDTWEFLSGEGLDLLILECTEGLASSDYDGHLDIKEFALVLERLHKIGAISDRTQVCSTHHSHNGDATYDELVEALGKLGAVAGYDGLVLEV